jgi:hypothetical protein
MRPAYLLAPMSCVARVFIGLVIGRLRPFVRLVFPELVALKPETWGTAIQRGRCRRVGNSI